jgi:hypothetical protein
MYHLVIFASETVKQKQHVKLRQNPWPLLRKKLRSAQWENDKAEKSSEEEDEDDKDKKAFMKSFMASWKSSKKDKKAQKNKRKRSDNDTSDSEQNYPTSFKLVALKPK